MRDPLVWLLQHLLPCTYTTVSESFALPWNYLNGLLPHVPA